MKIKGGRKEMNLFKILEFIMIGILASSPVFAEDESYVCVAEMTGCITPSAVSKDLL